VRALKIAGAALTALPLIATGAASAAPRDYAQQAFNILPPGQAGTLAPGPHSTDQLRLYDALTPLGGNVSAANVRSFFKPAGFRPTGKARREKLPMKGVTIVRDKFDTPHINGKTRAKVLFAAGWVTAEDRSLLLETLRGPGRVAALDAPGLDPFALAGSVRGFTPTPATEKRIDAQIKLLRKRGKAGRQAIKDTDAYAAGINAYQRKVKSTVKPWTRRDTVAVGALIGAKFGADGGDEARRSAFLSALQQKLGAQEGLGVFRDLSGADDPESPVSVPGRFPFEPNPTGATPGSAVVDAGSLDEGALNHSEVNGKAQASMSNALLVGRSRSATKRPLAVMGPQTGYFYPDIFLEVDLHGGGLNTRAAMLPGLTYPVIGRGADFAWSITSADSDNVDQFLEELCNPDGSPATRASTSYMYKGKCTPMTSIDAGLLAGSGSEAAREVVYNESVHGPISGTATVGGKPYAVSSDRSTRGRDVLSVLGLQDLNTGKVRSPKTFIKAVGKIDFAFNFFYVDNRHIAMYSAGRLPVRAAGVDPRLPALGTGQFDWKGFLKRAQHPQAIDPKGGTIVNWNNRPAQGFGTADNEWGTWGSVDRVKLLAITKRKSRLHDVVGVMNRAATQDARAVLVWPTINRLLSTGAPDARTAHAAQVLNAWALNGASRLDGDLDGKIDDPGAAILDAAWPEIAKSVMRPALGADLTDQLADFDRIDRNASDINSGASSNYGRGWYTYVEKDLRTLLGDQVAGPFSRRYCGGGDLNACRADVWAALKGASDELAAAQGDDPSAWRQDATAERIVFQPGLLGPSNTIRWTNRPSSFQQVMEFKGHRK
jgi:acyl-homoserine lactone acylase PvdQ